MESVDPEERRRAWPESHLLSDDEGKEIYFNVDWGHEWPLWTAYWPAEPADFGLSAELIGLLADFYTFWRQHYAHGMGWDKADNRELARTTATTLRALVQAEVGAEFEVVNTFVSSF